MIADIMLNKKFQAIIKELFIRSRKLNTSLVFITQSYFSVPKDVRLNSTHHVIMKISNRKELQSIAINHSANIDYNDFVKIYKECTREPYSFLTIDTTLPAHVDETRPDVVRGLIQLRGFHPSASTSGAHQSDAATSDKDKQICLSTLPRTGFNTEVCSYLAFHS